MTTNNKKAIQKKYITLDEGADFRKIAHIMSQAGFPMNHATARNQLMLAMENLLIDVSRQIGVKIEKKHIDDMLHNQDVHNSLADVLQLAYTELKKEGKLQ